MRIIVGLYRDYEGTLPVIFSDPSALNPKPYTGASRQHEFRVRAEGLGLGSSPHPPEVTIRMAYEAYNSRHENLVGQLVWAIAKKGK